MERWNKERNKDAEFLGADICGIAGTPGEERERAEAVEKSEGQMEEMEERMTKPGPERWKHEELLDAILQQTESIRIYDERSSNLVEEEVDIEPD